MIDFLKTYIARKKIKRIFFTLGIIIILLYLGFKVEFDFIRLFKGMPDMFALFERMLNPNLSYSGEVFEKLLETIQIAIVSSILGVILALPFSLLVAENITPNKLVAKILTAVFSFFRTIPGLIWAALLVSIFSIGKFSGIVALTIIAFLMSLKLFREYIESINENQLNSTISVGANSMQVLRYCVLPHILELSVSVFFNVFETNIRSATILGLVGAGGIGQIMWRDLNHLRYDNLGTLILILFLTIFLIDLISLFLRRMLKKSRIKFKSLESYRKYKSSKLIYIPLIIIGLFVLVFKSFDISYDRLLLGLEQGNQIISRMIRMDFSYYSKLIEGIKESFFIAIFATIVGGFFAIILSYFTAYNTSPNRAVSLILKGIINILRTFPPIITAIIFFRGVGPGPLAGAMALSIYTTGVLTKMYSEVLESSEKNIQDSVLVVGTTSLQSYRHGLVPHTLSTFVSLMLYRLESNIRNSTILGVIGAGGIGTALSMNITWRNWEKVGFLLLGVSLMVIAIDKFSNYLRKNI
ncbi:phosphonate ABC transporter, permease protein PhnE [Paratissierella segnis]|uniref:Phosphonate ABC transporter, permease protein PhnE n=1 Tax=Paratissierella segnis TaxID=2763679 RepID=A0A926EQW2_9FIRM|nr:phosphonate ABC transporter, permease protein PhnE [Paratissierella segnis]MBC8587156.1 phosphonate ABC transporter, permease protein PhnE [Paratissierella segnis]